MLRSNWPPRRPATWAANVRLVGAGAVIGLAGDAGAALFFALAGTALLALSLTTRYSATA